MGRLAGFTYREVARKLRTLGFAFDRQGPGSHEVWRHTVSGRKVTIPHHSHDMAEGTLRAILREAGKEGECRTMNNEFRPRRAHLSESRAAQTSRRLRCLRPTRFGARRQSRRVRPSTPSWLSGQALRHFQILSGGVPEHPEELDEPRRTAGLKGEPCATDRRLRRQVSQ